MARILITGISGSLARLVAWQLVRKGHEVIGVDYRNKPENLRSQILFYQASYNKTRIEDVFRRHTPEIVLHLGRVGNLKDTFNKRFDLNVMGSAKLMELAVKYKAKRFLVLSTFHIYGAHPHNHIPIYEDEPLRATRTFPELADAVQLDNQACTWLYRHRGLKTIVLRPVNVVGPSLQNTISRFLRQRTHVYMAGFNPMWQFIHERDMVDAIIRSALSNQVGIFNVTGPGQLPILDALELAGGTTLPMPALVAGPYLRLRQRLKPTVPAYMLDFLKYPCVVSGEAFSKQLGFKPRIGLVRTIRSTVYPVRPR